MEQIFLRPQQRRFAGLTGLRGDKIALGVQLAVLLATHAGLVFAIVAEVPLFLNDVIDILFFFLEVCEFF